MTQRFLCAAALLGVLFCATSARATNFAILLGSSPPDPNEQIVVKNPLYQGSGNQGENPLYEPRSLAFLPSELWLGQPAWLEVTMDRDLPSGLPSAPQGAFVFTASLTDAASGQAIHQFDHPISIYFDMGPLTPDAWVMGHLNEQTGQWESEAAAVTKKGDNLYCGTTDHFSVFYLAPVPEPSTWVLGCMAAAGAGCLVRRRRSPSRRS